MNEGEGFGSPLFIGRHSMTDTAKDKAYTVTKGNIVFDATGKKVEGEKATFSAAQAKALLAARVIAE